MSYVFFKISYDSSKVLFRVYMASSQQVASSTRSVGWGAARKVARRKVKKKRPPCFFKRVIFRIVSQLTEILEEATKHEGGWKNSRQFAQLSRTPIVLRSSYVNTKKVLSCFYKIIFKIRANLKRHNRAQILSSKHSLTNESVRSSSVILENHYVTHLHVQLMSISQSSAFQLINDFCALF